MSTFPGTPRTVKGGIVLVNPYTAAIERVISLQYNPDSLTRTFQVQGVEGDSSSTSEALRLKGPPVETLKLDAELDATDQLETADENALESGIQAQLAALETIIYPKSSQLINNNKISNSGDLEIVPMESSLALFIWNKDRIIPVKITEFSITEEAFDVNLNPIRARISLGMRVLNADSLGFDSKGNSIFMNYLQNKERLAGLAAGGDLSSLGIKKIL